MQWRGSGFVVLGWWYVVAVVGAVGVLMMAFGDVRWGGRIMAGGLVFGALVRLVARPDRKAGGLNVRSRAVDVLLLLGLAIGILVASATVKLDV
ncbi:DUF3017 domain-containing protein [Intrasporangium sp. DVR]|uniref:DUF3017 domain-containing protein n=1 Tax=Intrasporangium sp. DVR TaxID=3127867 RepID=UPI00313A72D4